MDRLCDELVQLIFYELNDPGPLAQSCKRFHTFAQDPYIRSHYFLTRYGEVDAMYHALGRGRIITERVLDILLMSGVHLSRYLVQIAIHHYFRTPGHFIKTRWVRRMSFRVFTYFLKLGEEMYGEIPHGKGEDDGSLFMAFLKESRFPPQMKSISWETIKEILEKYKFIPFSMKDPIMSQFPLALAVEPRLLPFAAANGFRMDSKYRDFVFRKMFERPNASMEIRAEDIAHNVGELCNLDTTMFVSRTVAAEICMEARSNEAGYNALKQLDKSGHLRFELSNLVEDLLKTFLTTRSICNVSTGDVLRHLYADFPSSDPAARLVILIVVFVAAEHLHHAPAIIQSRMETLGVAPVTRKDIYNVLVNPFVERYTMLLPYSRQEVRGDKEDSPKGMDMEEIKQLMEEVAVKCLEVACKGKLLKKIYDGFPSVHNAIMKLILEKYQIKLEDLPPSENASACRSYVAKLCHDFMIHGVGEVHTRESLLQGAPQPDSEEGQEMAVDEDEGDDDTDAEDVPAHSTASVEGPGSSASGLGAITQDTLSAMIRQDEVTPARSRRRAYYHHPMDTGKLHYPPDPVHVGRWAKTQFGVRSSITAVFMTHAVINENYSMLHNYLMYADGGGSNLPSTHVPITFKHFQILARLGRAPHFYIYYDIEQGAEFYLEERDYISKTDIAMALVKNAAVKTEAPLNSIPSSGPSPRAGPSTLASSPPNSRGRKRPRRSTATAVRSYAVPDSDDESIVDKASSFGEIDKQKVVKESSMQLWIKHLSSLLKQEERKYKEKKKQLERESEPGTKIRLGKSEFLKSLAPNLRNLRKVEAEKRLKYFGPEDFVHEYSDDDDEEYTMRQRKKRGKPLVLEHGSK